MECSLEPGLRVVAQRRYDPPGLAHRSQRSHLGRLAMTEGLGRCLWVVPPRGRPALPTSKPCQRPYGAYRRSSQSGRVAGNEVRPVIAGKEEPLFGQLKKQLNRGLFQAVTESSAVLFLRYLPIR